MMMVLLILVASSTLSTADQALEAGDWPSAIRAYQDCIDEDPDSFEAHFGLGRALAYSHRWDEAAKLFSDMLARWPDDADVRVARGLVYAWLERYDEAESDLVEVTAVNPDHEQAWRALGDVYLWSDRPEMAVEAFSHWIVLAPESPEPYLARSRAGQLAGQFRQAEFDLDRAGGRGVTGAAIDVRRRELREQRRSRLAGDWELATRYDYVGYAEERPAWHAGTTAVRRRLPFGSVAVESGITRRFDQRDALVAFDGYSMLWARAYTHVRVQSSPTAQVLPSWDLKLELFQGLPASLEVWANVRHMRFADVDVTMPGVGLGLYVGDWWMGEETVVVPSLGEVGAAATAMVRYSYDTLDDLLELRIGGGREVVELGDGRADTRRGLTTALRFQSFYSAHFGADVTVSVEVREDTPTGWGAALGTTFRW